MAVWIKGTLETPGPPGSQQPWAQKIWCYLSSSLGGWCSESHPGRSFSVAQHTRCSKAVVVGVCPTLQIRPSKGHLPWGLYSSVASVGCGEVEAK